MHYQSPPTVTFAKVDRPVHGLHPMLQKPVSCYIKEHIGRLLIIDTFKKTDSTHRHLISLILIFFVGKCSDPPDGFACFILQYPAYCFPETKSFVLLFIEYIMHILIEGSNICRVVLVNRHIHLYEFCS